MENAKVKLTPGQVVLLICGGVGLFAAVIIGFSGFNGLLETENTEVINSVFWILMMFSNLLIACANWKKQKVLSTVQIGMWSFFLGFFVCMLIFALTK